VVGPDDRRVGPGDRDWRTGFRQAAPLLGLGMQMALTMALFAGGGFWLDGKLSTTPLFTVAGAILAIVALVLLLVRVVRELDRGQDGDRSKRV
jgi:hypothetical protein